MAALANTVARKQLQNNSSANSGHALPFCQTAQHRYWTHSNRSYKFRKKTHSIHTLKHYQKTGFPTRMKASIISKIIWELKAPKLEIPNTDFNSSNKPGISKSSKNFWLANVFQSFCPSGLAVALPHVAAKPDCHCMAGKACKHAASKQTNQLSSISSISSVSFVYFFFFFFFDFFFFLLLSTLLAPFSFSCLSCLSCSRSFCLFFFFLSVLFSFFYNSSFTALLCFFVDVRSSSFLII